MGNEKHDQILDAVSRHVVLPPRLPFQDDLQGGAVNQALVERLVRHARAFKDIVEMQYCTTWSRICRSLIQFETLHGSKNGHLDKDVLKKALADFSNANAEKDILIIHIATQNAGLMVCRDNPKTYVFEAFEASPRAANVLASKAALQWDFPSRSVSVTSEVFTDPNFQEHIARFLEQASIEHVKDFAATTWKAGSTAFESRDTANPALVGQLLMALLEANGQAHSSNTTRKRVRDDVCWGDGAKNPWRRSPTWLVLRVGIQRALCLLLGGEDGTLHYKIFIAYFVAKLCEEMSGTEFIQTECLSHARAKLARRLAKLQTEKQIAPYGLSENIGRMLSIFDKAFKKALEVSDLRLTTKWANIRQSSQKRIPRLPWRADEGSLTLSLAYSRQRLQELCRQPYMHQQPLRNASLTSYLTTYPTIKKGPEEKELDVNLYLGLARFESEVELRSPSIMPPPVQPATHGKCSALAIKIQEYQQNALHAYDSNPEQLSVMILSIMELWTCLDLMALQLFPLLSNHQTGIKSELLYVLQLSQKSDLRRLRAVEDHLQDRHQAANHAIPSVFGDPSKKCFAVRYFEQSTDMQGLFRKITSEADRARELKQQEWETKSAEYESLLKRAAQKTCLYFNKINRFGETYSVHDRNGCDKCNLEHAATKIRIAVHEHPLPENQDAAKAAVFELLCPPGYSSWRDTTWNILHKLGRESQLTDTTSRLLLPEYSELRDHNTSEPCAITLASTTKSFLKTHYRGVHFPVPLEQVCFPNGLRLGLYDRLQQAWTARQPIKPSFACHCTSSFPVTSSYFSLKCILRAASDNAGRSANEIIASQTECPSALTPLEYMSFQEMLLGTKLRWIQLLRELSSPNINFGTSATVTLVSQLALQAGGPWKDGVLRSSHWVFTDDEFCYALIEQIRKRLEVVRSNWRETQTLECLITLVQQLWELATSTDVIQQAAILFKDIRIITLGWTRSLRLEVLTAKNGKTAQMRSRDALITALLFRRTYILETQESLQCLESEALTDFIECSVSLYDNMPEEGPGRISKMPLSLRNMIVHDLQTVYRLFKNLRQSVLSMGSAIDRALNRIWPVAAEAPPRSFTSWEFLPSPHQHWITAHSIATDGMRSQEVHYNIVEGSWLVDRQKLGQLPDEYIKHEFFRHLLGERLHFTRSSAMPGMTYVLAALIDGNQVHFGFRDGSPFMRALCGSQVLEAIPPQVFRGGVVSRDTDLPMALISDHFHWLDLNSRKLLIRPMASMWHQKMSDWTIDITTGQALRRFSRLVDVHSLIFQSIANIFEPFEYRNQILVYQPQKGNLKVHLQNLKIEFSVNRSGSLESQQLRAAIDENQDAGTFYGLDSKLVLRDLSNPRARSIIVAMGTIAIQQFNGHIRARSEPSIFYCRFSINTILNRLDCPPEPRVVYMKAYCHAITSFVLPDPLTGRTGTEEALHNLKSGMAQPWAPVDTEAYRWLQSIAALSPNRSYYPADMKVQQRVVWLESLSFAAQDDRFHPAVARILAQCRMLHRFNSESGKPPDDDSGMEYHLVQRAIVRNDLYEFHSSSNETESFSDTVYLARDRSSTAQQAEAFQAATMVKRWSHKMDVAADLAEILQQWPVIEGYQVEDPFQPYLLNELLCLDVASNWGSLFVYCQDTSRKHNFYGAMFFFATVAFGGRVDMLLVRTLIAFVTMREFQSLSIPKWEEFTHFRKNPAPTVEHLVQLMGPAVMPYPQDERDLLGGISLNYKQQRTLETAQSKYERSAKEARETLAEEMLRQWPCETPSVAISKDCDCVDLELAAKLVQSEWVELFRNHELWRHILEVQKILDSCESAGAILGPPMRPAEIRLYPTFTVAGAVPTMQEMIRSAESLLNYRFCVRNSSLEAEYGKNLSGGLVTHGHETAPMSKVGVNIDFARISSAPRLVNVNQIRKPNLEFLELNDIIRPLVDSGNAVRRVYGEHLNYSLGALMHLEEKAPKDTLSIDQAYLTEALASSEKAVKNQFEMICEELNRHPSFVWLSRGGLWPSLTPVTLLETLSSSSRVRCSGPLKDMIVAYGLLITTWQRLIRIEAASKIGNIPQMQEVFENEGHGEWSAKDYPDWLLLEIENNILIRPDQCKVARAMIAPDSGSNSVLQMNMGQGKSSVIIPMIAAVLADTKRLFRVIVPKPLLLQMAQLLQARLGGLLGRAIKHLPFSRRSSTSTDNIRAYMDLHYWTLKHQGSVLALPEHLLSFKLSGLQRLSSGKLEEAALMMQGQSWLLRKCRDVLDECDYSLAVKTQLVYPSGAQRMIDGHPHRWKVVEAVLRLVKEIVGQLHQEFPCSIEVTMPGNSGRFPTMHFSRDHVKEALIERITADICKGEGGILPINDCTDIELETVAVMLNKPRFAKDEIPRISDLFRNRQEARQCVLVLRGLLVYRILLMALSKRWNVQYGLHPTRDPVAVPYQAKGVPSDRAEFGHPDVAILLTCLSFYYSGLKEVQFEHVLRHVLKSDDPALEYDRWVLGADMLPASMRTWAAINVDDEIQRKELWNYMHYNMVVIDCFLNNFVFPYHAKSFERKLVSSAWDLPLPPAESTSKARKELDGEKRVVQFLPSMTTGFSGTNDNRTLLPMNIEQRDLAGLAHTNAEVLTYLLQRRNRHYFLAADRLGRRLTEYQLLQTFYSQGIRMLLDAGAQILELDNHDLVQTWLIIDKEAQAAVFFDKEDKARVLYKDGRSQPLVASHFNDNLKDCLVYLDEAHTRGTDLKMPAEAVAALTLGPGQTKDHTVQGKPHIPTRTLRLSGKAC